MICIFLKHQAITFDYYVLNGIHMNTIFIYDSLKCLKHIQDVFHALLCN